jgi:hypothetical protein
MPSSSLAPSSYPSMLPATSEGSKCELGEDVGVLVPNVALERLLCYCSVLHRLQQSVLVEDGERGRTETAETERPETVYYLLTIIYASSANAKLT